MSLNTIATAGVVHVHNEHNAPASDHTASAAHPPSLYLPAVTKIVSLKRMSALCNVKSKAVRPLAALAEWLMPDDTAGTLAVASSGANDCPRYKNVSAACSLQAGHLVQLRRKPGPLLCSQKAHFCLL